MSCRLIRDEKATPVRAIAWRRAETPSGESSAQDSNLYSDSGGGAAEWTGPGRRADDRIAEAYQRGLRDGETAAAQKTTGQAMAKVEQLSRSIEQLALHRAKIQREAEPELVRLALAIARRILRRELTIDPESLLGVLKAGLEKIESAEIHRVRVHPEHAAILTRLLEGSARAVEIVADPGLPVGAVIFETSRGSIDTGLETQLKEIERGFADIYPR